MFCTYVRKYQNPKYIPEDLTDFRGWRIANFLNSIHSISPAPPTVSNIFTLVVCSDWMFDLHKIAPGNLKRPPSFGVFLQILFFFFSFLFLFFSFSFSLLFFYSFFTLFFSQIDVSYSSQPIDQPWFLAAKPSR